MQDKDLDEQKDLKVVGYAKVGHTPIMVKGMLGRISDNGSVQSSRIESFNLLLHYFMHHPQRVMY